MADGQQSNHVIPSNAKFLDHIFLPIKPKTSFLYYSMNVQKGIHSQKPNLKISETSKLIGEQWRNLSDDEKEEQIQMAKKDKLRYE